MKRIITLVISLSFGHFNYAQSGKIIYDVKQNMEVIFGGEVEVKNLPDGMAEMFSEPQNFSKELLFHDGVSLYRDKKGEEMEDLNYSSDDGSIEIRIFQEEVPEILYVDHHSSKIIHQKGIMGKPFVIKDSFENLPWKITSEKVKFLNYECIKATYEEDDKLIVAWFTPEIAPYLGPSKYHSLPGTILLLNINDGETEFKAREIIKDDFSSEINAPKKGKKVSQKEYDEIKLEKEKEMREQMGNMEKRIEIDNH